MSTIADYVSPIYVPIVLNSIRHNPSAYNNQYILPAQMHMEISGELTKEQMALFRTKMEKNEPFVETHGISVHITGISTNMSARAKNINKFTGVVSSTMTSERTIKYLHLKFGKSLMWTIHYDNEIIHTMFHERPYKFNYKIVKFNCPHCNHGPLKAKDLLSVPCFDGDGEETGSKDMCPNCEEEIEFTHQQITSTDLAMYADKNKAARKKR
jgi:hypothetical protein